MTLASDKPPCPCPEGDQREVQRTLRVGVGGATCRVCFWFVFSWFSLHPSPHATNFLAKPLHLGFWGDEARTRLPGQASALRVLVAVTNLPATRPCYIKSVHCCTRVGYAKNGRRQVKSKNNRIIQRTPCLTLRVCAVCGEAWAAARAVSFGGRCEC